MEQRRTIHNILVSSAFLTIVGAIFYLSLGSGERASSDAVATTELVVPAFRHIFSEPTAQAAQTNEDVSSMPDISAPGKVASAQAAPIKPAAIAEASAVRPDPAPAPVRNTSGFNDGSYSAQGNYRTPDGTESIGVTLALKDGVITDASIEQTGYARESRRYQSRFAESFKQYVVGRSISSLSLSRVSGASLTTIGFNNALQQITAEARG